MVFLREHLQVDEAHQAETSVREHPRQKGAEEDVADEERRDDREDDPRNAAARSARSMTAPP